METIGQIIGFIFAGFLFWLAYKLYDKNKIAAGGLVVVIGALILLCSFQWFQGWAKSFVASNISSQLTALGRQVNTVQETTTEMHSKLDKHQAEIEKHQKELDEVQAKIRLAETNVINDQSDIKNQFQRLSMVQSDLATAQTNLASQEKELSDVEYWVKNLYGKITNETFSIKDTNHVLVASFTNDTVRLFVRLSQVPINGSVEEYIRDASSLSEQRGYPSGNCFKNIIEANFYKYDTNSLTLSFHYVVDTRETNFYRRMPKLNEQIWLFPDGSWNVIQLP